MVSKNIVSQIVICTLLLFFVAYFSVGIVLNENSVVYAKPFIIPLFVFYVWLKHRKKLPTLFYWFSFFFYVNEVLLLFWQHSNLIYELALIVSFCGYICLCYMGYLSVRKQKISSFSKGYKLLIVLINCMFLLSVFYFLKSIIPEKSLGIIIFFNSLSAISLGVIAVLYLSKVTSKKSYYYFFGAFCLIINDVFAAIGTYYFDDVILNTLDRVLHFSAFYLIYKFVSISKKRLKTT